MATIEVSTWTELTAALIAVDSSNNDITLTANIDCNDEIPLGVETSVAIGGNQNQIIYLHGGGHIIRNLRTSISKPLEVFTATNDSKTLVVDDLDFINLYLDKPLFDWYGQNVIKFNRCKFVGKRTDILMKMSTQYNRRVEYTSCFFNIPYVPTSSAYDIDKAPLQISQAGKSIANFCWFREHEMPRTSIVVTDSGKDCCDLSNLNLNGCYIDGTIVGWTTVSSSIIEGRLNLGNYSYHPVIQNVVDANIYFRPYDAQSPHFDSIELYCPGGVLKNYYYIYDTTTPISTTINNHNAETILATPAEMVDPVALYNKGFDIIIPET